MPCSFVSILAADMPRLINSKPQFVRLELLSLSGLPVLWSGQDLMYVSNAARKNMQAPTSARPTSPATASELSHKRENSLLHLKK